MSDVDGLLSGASDLLEELEGITMTLHEVANDGTRTNRTGLTVQVRDLPDAQDRINRQFMVPTATLTSGHPWRGDQLTDPDGNIWTITETDMEIGGRVTVEAWILQLRG